MNSKHTDSKCTVHDVTFVNIVCVCIAYYTQLHCQTLRYSFISSFTPSSNN